MTSRIRTHCFPASVRAAASILAALSLSVVPSSPCAAQPESRAREAVAQAARVHGEDTPAWADAVDGLVEQLAGEQKFGNPSVRELAERAVRTRERAVPVDERGLVRSLRAYALYTLPAADTTATQGALQRALQISERVYGADSGETAGLLLLQGRARAQAGDRPGARGVLQRARAIAEAKLPKSDRTNIAVLQELSLLERREGHLTEAEHLDREALLRAEGSADADSLTVASVLKDLGDLSIDSGDRAKARTLLSRALDIRQRAVGADHLLLVGPLRSLAFLDGQTGEFEAGRQRYTRALAILDANPDRDERELAGCLSGLGALLNEIGEYQQAKQTLERALEVGRQAYGPTSPGLGVILNNLALVEYSLWDHEAAIHLLEQAVSIYETSLGREHPSVGQSLANLAATLDRVGRSREAVALYERALPIFERAYAPDDPRIGQLLSLMAPALQQAGEHERAAQTYHRALDLLERRGERGRLSLPGLLADYARLQADMGDTAGAMASAQRALAVCEEVSGPDHLRVSWILRILARLQLAQGQLAPARSSLERSVAIQEAKLGKDHPRLSYAWRDLASVCLQEGNWAAASSFALRGEQNAREHLRALARGMPERQALAFAAVRANGIPAALAAAVRSGDPALAWSAWDALIRSRSLILDEMAMRRRLAAAAADPRLSATAEQVLAARTRLANLAVAGAQGPLAEYSAQLERARRDEEDLERRLASELNGSPRDVAQDSVGIAAVARYLPRGSALLAYATFPEHGDQQRFCALVMRAGVPGAVSVPLARATNVDSVVTRWRASLLAGAVPPGPLRKNAERMHRAVGEELRRCVWDQVAGLLTGVERVFVVPEGSLQRVNLAALPTSDGRYLLETGPLLHVLTAERDLVDQSFEAAAPRNRPGGLLAIGGPAFDAGSPAAGPGDGLQPAPAASYRGALSPCASLEDLRFETLAGSAAEARTISRTYQHDARSASTLLLGKDATEARFKAQCRGREVLHLATHGFFLDRECARPQPTATADERAPEEQAERAAATAQNPLLLSGLALAGANQRRSGPAPGEDGILTAEEVAGLDLTGTDWVVLSACSTGLGEAAAQEGVLGLQRAFRIAGARSVVLSLWPVGDDDTRQWMSDLYRERFEHGADTAAAVRAASLAALARERAAGAGTHPFAWGAFVAVGEWR